MAGMGGMLTLGSSPKCGVNHHPEHRAEQAQRHEECGGNASPFYYRPIDTPADEEPDNEAIDAEDAENENSTVVNWRRASWREIAWPVCDVPNRRDDRID
jgi:hypothetical protein